MHTGLLRWVLPALLALPACKSSVTVYDGSGNGAGGGGAGGAGGGGSPPTCPGLTPMCADSCGSDYFVGDAECIGGEWVCPPGSVNPAECPPSTCWGMPLSCEVCGNNGWECQPDEACAGGCDGAVCAECPGELETTIIGACTCSCSAGGMYSCELLEGCCNDDMDCGDLYYVPCVEHVCKQPVAGKCWGDGECPYGQHCQGASVCPCYYDCDGQDEPGECVPN